MWCDIEPLDLPVTGESVSTKQLSLHGRENLQVDCCGVTGHQQTWSFYRYMVFEQTWTYVATVSLTSMQDRDLLLFPREQRLCH